MLISALQADYRISNLLHWLKDPCCYLIYYPLAAS